MIYFIWAQSCELIKIGSTTRSPDIRLSDLQTGSPVRLSRLSLMRGGVDEERAIHLRFGRLRSHGEWFWADKSLVDFICESAEPWVVGDYSRFWSDEQKRACAEERVAKEKRMREALEVIRPGLPSISTAATVIKPPVPNIDLKRLRRELEARMSK